MPTTDLCCRIGVLLLPEFNGMAAHAFIDPFRAANYLRGKNLYRWEFLTLDAGPVTASNRLTVSGTNAYSNTRSDFDLIAVNASWTPEKHCSRKLKGWLNKAAKSGATLAAIDTGAFVLADAGLLGGYRATVHYEHIAAFRELFPGTQVEETLFVIDRYRCSSCGGMSACDLALEIVRLHHGIDLANAVAHYIFHDRLRNSEEIQQSPSHEPVGYSVPGVLRDAIILMERNLEEPLKLPELAGYLGISQRHLERLFMRHTGTTPVRYYINVRLDRVRGLVTQTEMPLAEIANACGFGGASQMSRSYKRRFDIAPGNDRTEGRIPFQFRSYPGFSGI